EQKMGFYYFTLARGPNLEASNFKVTSKVLN
ncbi:MAG: hypothetical protein ACI8XG_002331, partial [Congregibacter sp.]